MYLTVTFASSTVAFVRYKDKMVSLRIPKCSTDPRAALAQRSHVGILLLQFIPPFTCYSYSELATCLADPSSG